jgi:hypothetical protein
VACCSRGVPHSRLGCLQGSVKVLTVCNIPRLVHPVLALHNMALWYTTEGPMADSGNVQQLHDD